EACADSDCPAVAPLRAYSTPGQSRPHGAALRGKTPESSVGLGRRLHRTPALARSGGNESPARPSTNPDVHCHFRCQQLPCAPHTVHRRGGESGLRDSDLWEQRWTTFHSSELLSRRPWQFRAQSAAPQAEPSLRFFCYE